jgi:hypothetical protein
MTQEASASTAAARRRRRRRRRATAAAADQIHCRVGVDAAAAGRPRGGARGLAGALLVARRWLAA